MDSAASVANLMKGGGPKPHLSALVKKWFFICDFMNIRAVYRWVSRETFELRQVDELSKSTKVGLTEEGRQALTSRVEGPVCVVNLSKLGNTINMIVGASLTMNVLVPRWEAKSWWPTVAKGAELVPCPSGFITFYGAGARKTPNWDFLVACFNFYK